MSPQPTNSPHIKSAFNLRDMGGIRAIDGRHTKYGILYRSGTMTYLTESDTALLRAFNISTVCDLRRPGERAAEPSYWCQSADVEYWSREYDDSSGVLSEVLRSNSITPEALREAMIETYRNIPIDHAPSYKSIFERILSGKVPLLFNCAAGKDRTGVCAALILHSIGIDNKYIFKDYLLTNEFADFSELFRKQNSNRIRTIYENAPSDVRPLFEAREEYLLEMQNFITDKFGSIDNYLESQLGIDLRARETLKKILLE